MFTLFFHNFWVPDGNRTHLTAATERSFTTKLQAPYFLINIIVFSKKEKPLRRKVGGAVVFSFRSRRSFGSSARRTAPNAESSLPFPRPPARPTPSPERRPSPKRGTLADTAPDASAARASGPPPGAS